MIEKLVGIVRYIYVYRLPNLFVAFPMKEKHITAAFRFNFLISLVDIVYIGSCAVAVAARNVFGRHSSDVSMFDMLQNNMTLTFFISLSFFSTNDTCFGFYIY